MAAPIVLDDLGGSSRRGRALAGGLVTAREVDRLVADGLLRQVVGGVHVAADVPDQVEVRARGAGSAIPARLQGLGAAVWVGSALWIYSGGPPPERLDVVLERGRDRPGEDDVQVSVHRLLAGDVVHLAGTPVTSPARTAADLARLHPTGEALVELRRLSEATGVSAPDIAARLEEMGRARGVVRARATLRSWRGTG